MRTVKRWQVVIAALTVVILASALTIVLAGPPAQEPPSSEEGVRQGDAGFPGDEPVAVPPGASEPGTQGSSGPSASAARSTEPQPDEDGYTGPRLSADPAAIPPSEGSASRPPPPDWDALTTGPQPDEDATYGEGDVSAEYAATLSYLHVAGTALRPRDSSTNWFYGGSGCVYVEGALHNLNIDVQIPEGSLVEYLRIYYFDTNASDSTAWLTRYFEDPLDPGTLTFQDIAVVFSDGDSGYGTTVNDPAVAHEVDAYNNRYVLNWRPAVSGSSLQLCGLRIAYRLPD
jgi:hypothetical protein